MKKNLMAIFLTILSVLTNAQTNKQITIGVTDSVHSEILNEQRTVWIFHPEENLGTLSNKKYPVIYVLDGESHFKSVAVMVQRLSSSYMIPPVIVVGILNTNRKRDLTPTVMDASDKNSGGGEQFLSFIAKELIPQIEKKYQPAPYKVLMGHSLGGLTVMNTLIHHKDLFNAYVSIDASMWWDKQKLLHESKTALQNNNYSGKRLFLAIANGMEKGIDTQSVQKDTSKNSELIRYNLQLIKEINGQKQSQLVFKNQYYPDDSHSSVPLIAAYDALRFIFDYYDFTIYKSYLDNGKIPFDTLLVEHFNNVSMQLGYSVKPVEDLVNVLAYYSLSQKQYDRAENLFRMNTINFGQSSNAWDSMGDFYNQKGEKAKAVEFYKKALAIKENLLTRQKLESLEKI